MNMISFATDVYKNWKNILLVASLIWCVVCTAFHCGHITPGDSTVITSDTTIVYPDTNKVIELPGFNTQPVQVVYLPSPTFKPVLPDFSEAETDSDSIQTLLFVAQELTSIILKCDSSYTEDTALRSYADTLYGDKGNVTVSFKVFGRLMGDPVIGYTNKVPKITIENKEVTTVGPRSKVYVEAGAGSRFGWTGNEFKSVVGSVGLGFTTKSNWSFGAEGSFAGLDYTAQVKVRKSFDVGR